MYRNVSSRIIQSLWTNGFFRRLIAATCAYCHKTIPVFQERAWYKHFRDVKVLPRFVRETATHWVVVSCWWKVVPSNIFDAGEHTHSFSVREINFSIFFHRNFIVLHARKVLLRAFIKMFEQKVYTNWSNDIFIFVSMYSIRTDDSLKT